MKKWTKRFLLFSAGYQLHKFICDMRSTVADFIQAFESSQQDDLEYVQTIVAKTLDGRTHEVIINP